VHGCARSPRPLWLNSSCIKPIRHNIFPSHLDSTHSDPTIEIFPRNVRSTDFDLTSGNIPSCLYVTHFSFTIGILVIFELNTFPLSPSILHAEQQKSV
jgi:hypothetical protein